MGNCPNCGSEDVVIRIDNGDGTFTYPPVIDNIVTLPPDPEETEWVGVEGPAIVITNGGPDGHSPVIGVLVGDGLALDGAGALVVDGGAISPDWSSPNSGSPIAGISVFPGGTDGHTPSFGLSIHPDSDNVSIVGGQLLIECCEDLPWQGGSGPGISVTPGDNPAGASGNGHRPELAVLVDGVTIGIDGDGNLVALGAAVADLCPSVAALPVVPGGVNVDTLLGVGDDGNCYRVESCIVYADAGGDPWNAANANWVDPTTIAEWCELRLSNGITGSELWRNLDDTNGVLQWHQVA